MIKPFDKDWKPVLVKIALVIVLLSLLGMTLKAVYDKREVLSFAFTNSTKVEWLIEANRQAQSDADMKVKESLSTLFITE